MITVARILRSQGQKGELRVRFFYLTPEECQGLRSVFIGIGGELREYLVESLVPHGKDFDLKLKRVDSLSQADRLAGLEVLVPEDALKARGKDEFFVFQLIGCTVIDTHGKTAGQVKDVVSAGSGEILVVGGEGKEILIPFHESICVEVDLHGKRIRIDPPEGLLDLNEI